MYTRARLLDSGLLIIALLGPFFHMLGFLTRGMALFYTDYVRIAITYLLLALSAGAAAFLLASKRSGTMQAIAALALVANLGFVAYTGGVWSRDMRRRLEDATMSPIEGNKIGIVIAPAIQDAQVSEMRPIEDQIRYILRANGLDSYVVVRHSHAISSEEQARRMGERLRANIVVWKTWQEPDQIYRHVTILGAKEINFRLDPVNLMLLMATQKTITVPITGDTSEANSSRFATQVVAPIVAGFGALALEQPLVAGAQFQGALQVSDIPTTTLQTLHNCMGVALSYAERPDLATKEYLLAQEVGPNADAWIGLGIVALMERRWEDAQIAFAEARALDPYDPTAYCGLGIVAAHEHNLMRASSAYRQALALDPTGNVPHALLGMTYELGGDIPAARQAYLTSALQAGPNLGLQEAAQQRAEEIVRNPPTAVPTATRVPIPTVTPVPTSALYYVEQGDTLKAIAEEFEVSIESLIEINQIDDPNAIRVGQRLMIPQQP